MRQGPEETKNRYCLYEPILPRIEEMRVVVVDDLVKHETDFSEVARREPDFHAERWLRRERMIAALALSNIESNIRRLIKRPEIHVAHLSDMNLDLVERIDPDAIVLSGTLRDFDYYDPAMIARFADFARETTVPILGICGGHQLLGLAFGTRIITLDRKEPSERRDDRLVEYQYRYVKIVRDDAIFDRIDDATNGVFPTGRVGRRGILRVWQNHGLMLDRMPDGFVQLASGYMCPIQMIVRRTDRQLIYAVQFHIEKSFEDFNRPKVFWDHHVESRDGRIIFENFLVEALKHRA